MRLQCISDTIIDHLTSSIPVWFCDSSFALRSSFASPSVVLRFGVGVVGVVGCGRAAAEALEALAAGEDALVLRRWLLRRPAFALMLLLLVWLPTGDGARPHELLRVRRRRAASALRLQATYAVGSNRARGLAAYTHTHTPLERLMSSVWLVTLELAMTRGERLRPSLRALAAGLRLETRVELLGFGRGALALVVLLPVLRELVRVRVRSCLDVFCVCTTSLNSFFSFRFSRFCFANFSRSRRSSTSRSFNWCCND